MIDWMAANAAFVQAVASIVSVLVTIILALITYQYVQLTKRLVEASDVQLRQVQVRRINALLAAVKTMLLLVADLPEQAEDVESVVTAALWSGDNVTELQSHASKYNRRHGERAAVAAASLRWLHDQAQVLKEMSPDHRQDLFPWDQWRAHKQRATKELEAIWSDLPSAEQIDSGKRRTDKPRERE